MFTGKRDNPRRILFFSKGRGYGHAVRDLYLANELVKNFENCNISFVSYSTGAEVIKKSCYKLFDLELSDNNEFCETLTAGCRVIERFNPDIIISHEEFAAFPAANIYNKKIMYISSWLPPIGTVQAETLQYAESILVFCEIGVFPIPPRLKVKPIFLGPLVRNMLVSSTKQEIRQGLNVDAQDFLISVIPGGWATEERAPLAGQLIWAFNNLSVQNKSLVWVSNRDHHVLDSLANNAENIQVLKFTSEIAPVMAASDLIITKGNRGTLLEAADLGVPSLSVSYGHNVIDEILIPRIKNNTTLNAKAASGEALLSHIEHAAKKVNIRQFPHPQVFSDGRSRILKTFHEEISRILN